MKRRVWVYDGSVILLGLTAVLALFLTYDPILGIVPLVIYLTVLLLFAMLSTGGKERIVTWNQAAWGLVILCALVALLFLLQAVPLYLVSNVGALSGLKYWVDGTELQPAPGVPGLLLALVKSQPRMNSVAVGLEGVLFLTIGLAITTRSRQKRLGALAAIALMAVALVASNSEGAWLAVLAAGLVWLAIYWRPARYLAFALGAALVALVGFVIISGNINALQRVPLLSGVLSALFLRPDRLQVYYNSLLLIQDFPLTGIGFGHVFGATYARYTLLIPWVYLTNSHNLYLEVWLQQGVLGLAAFITLAVSILVNTRCRLKGVERLRFQATWVGLLAMLLHGFIDARKYDDTLAWLPFFCLLALNARLLVHEDTGMPVTRRLGWIAPGVGALFLLAVVLLRPQAAPLPALFWSNRGALAQQRADLDSTLPEAQKKTLAQQAWASYIKALSWQPDNPTANYRLGLLALDACDFPTAVRYLEAAYVANPGHGGVSKALGLAYTFTGSLPAARPLLENVPDIVPELNYWGGYFLQEKAAAGLLTPELKAAGLNALRLSYQLNSSQAELKQFLEQEGQ